MTEHEWHMRAMRAEDRSEKAESELVVAKQNALAILAMKQTSEDALAKAESEVARLRAALGRIAEAREDDHACDIADAALESSHDQT